MNATRCTACNRMILLRGSLKAVTGRAVQHKSCYLKRRR
jgi:hypothetical protein